MTASLFKGCGGKNRPDLRRPPQWAECLLVFLLKSRDREAIPEDLLEEYREDRLPLLGYVCANFWYGRQVFGIACFQSFEGAQ